MSEYQLASAASALNAPSAPKISLRSASVAAASILIRMRVVGAFGSNGGVFVDPAGIDGAVGLGAVVVVGAAVVVVEPNVVVGGALGVVWHAVTSTRDATITTGNAIR